MKSIFITLVKLYRRGVSPFLGQSCRFHPTCSTYMIGALEDHGAIKGLWLGLRRLLKCHPYYKGDFIDEVPSSPIEPVSRPSAGKSRNVDCK